MQLRLVNLGRTPAYVETLDTTVALRNRAELAAQEAHAAGKLVTVAAWLGASESSGAYAVEFREPQATVREARQDPNSAEAILGRIIYRDVYGTTHETGFAHEWLSANKLRPIDNPRLNYTRAIAR